MILIYVGLFDDEESITSFWMTSTAGNARDKNERKEDREDEEGGADLETLLTLE
jgi:hypothetical protein